MRTCIEQMVLSMRAENPALVPGEIYDEIAQELERRCKAVIGERAVATELYQTEEEINGEE